MWEKERNACSRENTDFSRGVKANNWNFKQFYKFGSLLHSQIAAKIFFKDVLFDYLHVLVCLQDLHSRVIIALFSLLIIWHSRISNAYRWGGKTCINENCQWIKRKARISGFRPLRTWSVLKKRLFKIPFQKLTIDWPLCWRNNTGVEALTLHSVNPRSVLVLQVSPVLIPWTQS